MKPVDVGATVGADGVEIKLPRLRVVVERRQAERLRDALATVLPEQIEDLMHDPRVKDADVLAAAAAIAVETDAAGNASVDQYIADSQAPHLGLYLTPQAGKPKHYHVMRRSDGLDLFAGDRVQVRLFLRGYGAAQASTDTCIGCCEKFERESMIDSGWLYGLVCCGCAEGVIDDIKAALTARVPSEAVS